MNCFLQGLETIPVAVFVEKSFVAAGFGLSALVIDDETLATHNGVSAHAVADSQDSNKRFEPLSEY